MRHVPCDPPVEAVHETADVASDVVTKLWQSIVIASLLSGIAPEVPRANLSGIGGMICGVPRGSWANRGPICGHVGLPATTSNTPSQTKGPIILMQTPGLLAVVTGPL